MLSISMISGFVSLSVLILTIAVYGGYYLYMSRKRRINVSRDGFSAKITVVIPTYNEEATITKKLENMSKQTYPMDSMEIIMIDSNSKDGTVKLAEKYLEHHKELNMRIIREDERKGKSHAINKAFSAASRQSEILLMTDVDAFLKEDSIEKAVSLFADPKIGAVSGMQVLLNTEDSRETKSAGMYNRFWVKLRIGESAVDSTPVFSGELAAYRADLLRGLGLRENMNADDSQLAIMVRRKGYRCIRDPDIIYYEYAPKDWGSSQIQKVRRGQGLSRLFWYNKDMMFRKKYGKFGLVILPVNFYAHLISPFLVLLSLLFGVIFLFGFVFQGMLFLLGVSGLLAMFLSDYLLLRGKFAHLFLAFVEYQIILSRGILLFVFGKSLHKWQKVESIRTEFRKETTVN